MTRGQVDDAGTQLRFAGWRQGSVVESDVLLAISTTDSNLGNSLAVVISQDCDIVQSTDIEPAVEIILCRQVVAPRPDCQYGRNPREIDLPLKYLQQSWHYATFKVRDRLHLPKMQLAPFLPSAQCALERTTVAQLVQWIAKRYTRVAWPDEFNERLRSVDGRLERLFKSDDSTVITGIWLALEPRSDELLPDQNYRLSVWATILPETRKDPSKSRKVENFERRLEDILQSCSGIEIMEVETRSESQVTLHDLRYFHRFDRDYRSFAPNPSGNLPPNGV